MGRGIDDIRDELEFFPYEVIGHGQEMVKIKVNQREYTPPEISAMILKELKFIAEKELKTQCCTSGDYRSCIFQ